jgi:hypothetical protein
MTLVTEQRRATSRLESNSTTPEYEIQVNTSIYLAKLFLYFIHPNWGTVSQAFQGPKLKPALAQCNYSTKFTETVRKYLRHTSKRRQAVRNEATDLL